MLETEPELAIEKQDLPGEDFFWYICSPIKIGVSAAGWIGVAI